MRGHEVAALSGWTYRGIPIERPGEAWCRLAGMLSSRELVIAADSLMRRQSPISSQEELVAAVGRWGGRRGAIALRAALARARARTDSVAESELRMDAEDAGLPPFEVNREIHDEHGRRVAFGDLVDAAHRVLLEYDGEQHRLDSRQYARDVDRLDELARLGWRVIRVNKSHRGPARTRQLARTREALLARGWQPGTPSS